MPAFQPGVRDRHLQQVQPIPMTSAGELRSGKTHRDENFPVASWIIHPRHRALILAFYNFVRIADDIADHTSLDAQTKLKLLDELEGLFAIFRAEAGVDVLGVAVAGLDVAGDRERLRLRAGSSRSIRLFSPRRSASFLASCSSAIPVLFVVS